MRASNNIELTNSILEEDQMSIRPRITITQDPHRHGQEERLLALEKVAGLPDKHKHAKLTKAGEAGNVPEKRGGGTPPLGPLAGGRGARNAGRVRTGKVRSYGLRTMAR